MPFFDKRTKRNTAIAAVMVWLFALSTGIANACVLESPEQHGAGAANEHSHVHRHVHAGESVSEHSHGKAPGGAAVAHHDGNGHSLDTGKDACLKVCDGSKAPVKLQTNLDMPQCGMPPVVAVIWDSATPMTWASSPIKGLQPTIDGPPLRIRFSRLAL